MKFRPKSLCLSSIKHVMARAACATCVQVSTAGCNLVHTNDTLLCRIDGKSDCTSMTAIANEKKDNNKKAYTV